MSDNSDKDNLMRNPLTCKPLYSYDEVFDFLDNPPVWRSLCKELKQHSRYVIKNIEMNENYNEESHKSAQMFCHFDSLENVDDVDIKRHEKKNLPKTLICHDMANGYHDDSVVDGTDTFDAYTFYNWGVIDIFCYFSHHFVTIPPLGWINVAHAHGVKVIGTVITEWSNGAVIWENILKSELEWRNFASALTAIAKCMRFDGWLLNIENSISKPAELLEFVSYLHKILHQEVPGSLLIWYDSVTVEGRLAWQNGLNEKNRAFFDSTDGIFTNYSWSEANIESSVAAAGDRLHDVYVGIDVWGRNFYGGGKFNTAKAVEIVHRHDCSLAIFAPAWTHEAIQNDTDHDVIAPDSLSKYERYSLRERALWGSLWPYLNTKLPCTLPFRTSFCRGQGKMRTMYGEVICPVPWYNLRHMQYQPNSLRCPHGYILMTEDHLQRNLRRLCHIVTEKDYEVFMSFRKFFISDVEIKNRKAKIESTSSIYTDNEAPSTSGDPILESNEVDIEQPPGGDDYGVINKLWSESKHLVQRKSFSSKNAHTSTRDANKTIDGNEIVLVHVPDEQECLQIYFDDAYIGGSCIKVNPTVNGSEKHVTPIRLFHCDFFWEDTLVACVVTKQIAENNKQYLNITLETIDLFGKTLKVLLIDDDASFSDQSVSNAVTVYPTNGRNGVGFQDLQKYILLEEPDFYIPVENDYGWRVRYYEIPLGASRVVSVRCGAGLQQGGILLGHFGLCHRATSSHQLAGLNHHGAVQNQPI